MDDAHRVEDLEREVAQLKRGVEAMRAQVNELQDPANLLKEMPL